MSADLDEFHGEAREILDAVAGDLVRLESAPDDADLVNRIFRGAHSLKGLAGMLGFTGVSQVAHKLESVLEGVRMGRIPVGPDVLDVLLEGTEVLARMVDGIKDGEPDREASAAQVVTEKLLGLASSVKKEGGSKKSIDPEIAKLLSEYEEHRLSEALGRGDRPWKIEVTFPFDTFDTDLPAVKDRLKHYSEVITTMAGDLAEADKMGFGLLVTSTKDPSVLLVAVAVTGATISPVTVREDGPPGSSSAPSSTAPSSGGSGGAFDGFSGAGMPSFPSTPASALAAPDIDWMALANQGDVAGPSPRPREPGRTGTAADRRAPAETGAPPTVDTEDRRGGGERRSGQDRRSVPREPAAAARRDEVIVAAGASAVGSTTLRVNLERIDALMNLVGELVTAKNAIAQVADKLRSDTGFKGTTIEIYKANRQLSRRLDELQKGIMQVRMLPLEMLFSKLTRVVRNLSRENGKDVELEIVGAETEIDKVMIDELSDPLIHIVRNAVDHGIEDPSTRLDVGKPERGTLRIVAQPKGNHVSIEITDDGRGLDTERIREKAIEKGLLSREATPSQDELFDLIYAPGFSTKETVSEVSGRGVGMDVVRNNIMKLNGIIDTTSEKGRGTKFTITLPLTLATMKALLVGVAGQTYAIPLASVLECVSPKVTEIRTVEGRDVLPLREVTLPLVRLDRFFAHDDFSLDAPATRVHVVVVGLAQYRIGLVVDSLGAQQDVVVKPLGAPLTQVEGIMGATNLGNNRPVLVLDVAGVVNSSVGIKPAAKPGEVRT